MLERKSGLVLTMASAAALRPTGIIPIYESSKSYVLQLSNSLQNAYPTKETETVLNSFSQIWVSMSWTKK